MIREGKRAEVKGCQEAITKKPVLAVVQIPKAGNVKESMEKACEVRKAIVKVPKQQAGQKARLHLLNRVSCKKAIENAVTKLADITPVQTSTVKADYYREELLQPQDISCKRAEEDITLNVLFCEWKES